MLEALMIILNNLMLSCRLSYQFSSYNNTQNRCTLSGFVLTPRWRHKKHPN